MSTTRRILAADDSLTIRKLVEMVLRQEGYEVDMAETGAECLAKARETKPDLILLDYILPDMQGTEVCQSLINTPETWEIPVLMMSGNGNAIRQLYQDYNNVADYLTKPFAPSVLKAVIGHTLQKDTPEERPAEAAPQAAASAVEAAPANVNPEFVEKVNRLMEMLDKNPFVPPDSATDFARQVAPPKAPARPRRRTKVVMPVAEVVQRKFRRAIHKHLAAGLRNIPDWEAFRGAEGAESYYLTKLLSTKVLREISSDLVKAAGVTSKEFGSFRVSAQLSSVISVFEHLRGSKACGWLELELPEENVQAFIHEGEVIYVTSNHPRNYCSGSRFNFHSLQPSTIGEAVRTQEESSTPFFVHLADTGALPEGSDLGELLVQAGENSIVRAFQCANTVCAFYPQDKLPKHVRQHRQEFHFASLMLACHRTVDDWLSIEQGLPDLGAVMIRHEDCDAQLGVMNLEDKEAAVIDLVNGRSTLQHILDEAGLGTFEGSKIIYRFLKSGLIYAGVAMEEEPTTMPDTDFYTRPPVVPVSPLAGAVTHTAA